MSKPSLDKIKREIRTLRKFIEDENNDWLERRIAQVMEDTLRWSIEDTDWADPSTECDGMASIIRRDFERQYPQLKPKVIARTRSGALIGGGDGGDSAGKGGE